MFFKGDIMILPFQIFPMVRRGQIRVGYHLSLDEPDIFLFAILCDLRDFLDDPICSLLLLFCASLFFSSDSAIPLPSGCTACFGMG